MAGIMKIKRSACRKLVVKRKENRPYGRTRRRWRIILKRTLRKRGGAGLHMVKVLCYKSEGRWYDSRCCHWNFSLT